MKLRVIVVGRDRGDVLCQEAEAYLARLVHYVPAEIVEIKEEPATRSVPIEQVKAKEAERIKKVIGPSDYVVALDERGKAWSSVELSKQLARWRDEGRSTISFVIGGPSGLDSSWVRSVQAVWSLSKLTLPHRLARLLVMEQLYRAMTIQRGEPYHK